MPLLGKQFGVFKELHLAARREIMANRFNPLYALVFLTYRCTSSCGCCNIWKRNSENKSNEMGIQEWMVVIDRLHNSGVRGIEIFGGDALLRKDIIFDLIDYCRLKGIETFLPTNSNLIDEDTARRLVEGGLTAFYFSLDGTKEVHDAIRGLKGSYDRVVKAVAEVAKFRKNGFRPEIVINTTVSRLNYKLIPEFLEKITFLPIDAVEFGYVSEVPKNAVRNSTVNGISSDPYFVSTDGESHLLSEGEALELYKIVREVQKSRNRYPYRLLMDNLLVLSAREFEKGEFPPVRCLRAAIEPTITPYGDTLPCPFFSEYSLGNLYNNKLETIWGNKPHREFVRVQREKKIDICRYCNTLLFKKGLRLTLKNHLKQWFA